MAIRPSGRFTLTVDPSETESSSETTITFVPDVVAAPSGPTKRQLRRWKKNNHPGVPPIGRIRRPPVPKVRKQRRPESNIQLLFETTQKYDKVCPRGGGPNVSSYCYYPQKGAHCPDEDPNSPLCDARRFEIKEIKNSPEKSYPLERAIFFTNKALVAFGSGIAKRRKYSLYVTKDTPEGLPLIEFDNNLIPKLLQTYIFLDHGKKRQEDIDLNIIRAGDRDIAEYKDNDGFQPFGSRVLVDYARNAQGQPSGPPDPARVSGLNFTKRYHYQAEAQIKKSFQLMWWALRDLASVLAFFKGQDNIPTRPVRSTKLNRQLYNAGLTFVNERIPTRITHALKKFMEIVVNRPLRGVKLLINADKWSLTPNSVSAHAAGSIIDFTQNLEKLMFALNKGFNSAPAGNAGTALADMVKNADYIDLHVNVINFDAYFDKKDAIEVAIGLGIVPTAYVEAMGEDYIRAERSPIVPRVEIPGLVHGYAGNGDPITYLFSGEPDSFFNVGGDGGEDSDDPRLYPALYNASVTTSPNRPSDSYTNNNNNQSDFFMPQQIRPMSPQRFNQLMQIANLRTPPQSPHPSLPRGSPQSSPSRFDTVVTPLPPDFDDEYQQFFGPDQDS